MDHEYSHNTVPRRIAIVGAGMVGLSAAWFLQEHGADITVYDRGRPGGGASRGNAGWITPDLVEPLASPEALRQGAISSLLPGSTISINSASPDMLSFIAHFVRNCTRRRYARGSESLVPLKVDALAAFDELELGGAGSTVRAPILAVFSSEAARNSFIDAHPASDSRHAANMKPLSGAQARDLEPSLTAKVAAAVRIDGQRYLDPTLFTARLASSVEDRGGRVNAGVSIDSVDQQHQHVAVRTADGNVEHYDAVLLANGAELTRLAKPHGVTIPVAAGRGYSFTTIPRTPSKMAVYIPEERLACTPMSEGYRIVGVMEFAQHGGDPRKGRVSGMFSSAVTFFNDLSGKPPENSWVGSRPCTPDGLPVLGETRSRGIFVAGRSRNVGNHAGAHIWQAHCWPNDGRINAGPVRIRPAEIGLDVRRRGGRNLRTNR